MHRIIIVGGGAGGLELATRLGKTLGRRREAHITLVDQSRVHLWKPLLHEIAAGSANAAAEEIDFLAQASWYHFQFRLGRVDGLDRNAKRISLAPTLDADGTEIVPPRTFEYDTLVLALGSVSNDFGIPGGTEHAHRLDTREEALAFNRVLLNACLHLQTQTTPADPGQLNVVIVGGGATGVELAAELHTTTRLIAQYGLDRIDPDKNMRIVILQASNRILKDLPERVSDEVARELSALGIAIHTNERVSRVSQNGVETSSGRFFAARMVVWAAGIKADDVLRELDGLEVASSSQLVVTPGLRTTRDSNVFAFGDCAHCATDQGIVPPRAQAAHQQARFLAKALDAHIAGRKIGMYRYRDFGSLISLGRYTTVGSLMSSLARRNFFVEGQFARLMYWSLYKQHQAVVLGFGRTVLLTLSSWIGRSAHPRVKLH